MIKWKQLSLLEEGKALEDVFTIANKNFNSRLIVGTGKYKSFEETANAVENDLFCIELDKIAVKGKTDAIRIFTVLGNNDWVFHNTAWYMNQQQHEKFLNLYRNQNWLHAERFATDLKREWPEMSDYYDVMLTRIYEFKDNSPGEDWDGVYRAETK